MKMKITKKVGIIAVAAGMFVAAGGYFVIAGLGTAPGGMTTGTASGDINKGLVGHWPLDIESLQSATTFADKTPNENVGAKYGSVLKFDGGNDYVDFVSNNPIGTAENGFTMSAWINKNAGSYNQIINGETIQFRDSRIYVKDVNDIFKSLDFASDIPANGNWYHATMTYETGGMLRVYVDGIEAINSPLTGIATPIKNMSEFRIGKRTTTEFFNGSIGETRIYSRALTEAEVTTLYQGGVVSSDNLEAHYKMKDKSGATLTDETANNNDGTLTNFNFTGVGEGNDEVDGWVTNDTPNVFALDRMGQSNRAMSFDGASDYINCGNGDSLDAHLNDWTIGVWAKGYEAIIDKRNSSGQHGYGIYWAQDGKIYTVFYDGSYTVGTSNTYSSSEWHYIVAVADRDANLTIYVDGIADGSMDISGLSATNLNSVLNPIIGYKSYSGSSWNYFNGSIADVRIYNRALGEGEITSLYDMYRPKVVINDISKGLVLHQPLDIESLQSATTFADKTPNENVGTKYGSVLKFDGDNDYVDCGSGDSLDITDEITISAWFKIGDSDSVDDKILRKTNVFDIHIYDGGANDLKFRILLNNGSWVGPTPLNDFTITRNIWHCVCATWDGTIIKYFYDGNIGQTTTSMNGFLTTNSEILYIGTDGLTDYFNGSIGETRIYNRALTEAEVLTLYQGGSVTDGGSLKGHWNMNNKSGTTLTDHSGNSNTGTLTNFADTSAGGGNAPDDSGWVTNDTPNVFATDRKGQSNRAMSFDGTSDYIDCGNDESLNITEAITISAWVKPATITAGWMLPLSKRIDYTTNDPYEFMINNDLLYFRIAGATEADNVDGGSVMLLNEWQHIVGTWDGATMVLYHNNVSVGTPVTHTEKIRINDKDLAIGTNASLHQKFNGSIADVRIYNRALSQNEITSLYDMYRPKLSAGSLQKGLVLDMPLKSKYMKSATILTDRTPNSNDGIAINGATVGTDYTNFVATDTEYIDIGNAGVSLKSVSVWVKPTSATESIVDFDGGTHSLSTSTTTLAATGFSSPTIYVNGAVSSTITTGDWNFVTITTATAFNVSDFDIGRIAASYLNGDVADVRVYDRALSATEITSLYDLGR